MGQMAELNLAACREENCRLRALVLQQQRVIAGMQERDRAGAIEVAFVAAALSGVDLETSWDEDSGIEKAVRRGRTAARLYIAQLMAEAEKTTDNKAEVDG